MHKWIGIRVSAVLTILGSVATLLLAGLMLWTAFHASQLDTRVESPVALKGMMAALAAFFTAFSVWGFATGTGIFRRRGWARLSMIIFAVLLVGMGGSALVGILFIRFPEAGGISAQAMQNVRVGIAAFYGAMTVIGAWWLLLFNSNPTKRYFEEEREEAARRAQPLSISVIGWYLLVCAVVTAAGAITRVPAMLFGVILTGWGALAVYTAFTAVQIYLGSGLLQFQESARLASLGYFGLMTANVVVMVGLPGFAERIRLAQQSLPGFLGAGRTPMIEGARGLMMVGMLAVVVPMWFLVRRRAAFRQ
jgi:hypothetical protein